MGGIVYEDLNRNQTYQPGLEPGIGGASIYIYGPVNLTVESNEHGWWQVGGIPLGEYTVTITPPTGYEVLFPPMHRVTLTNKCQHILNLHFGLVEQPTPTPTFTPTPSPTPSTGIVQGFVWSDEDQDGVRDPDEPGVPGIVIRLTPIDGGDGWETTTDENGAYQFTDVPPGDYEISIVYPGGVYIIGDLNKRVSVGANVTVGMNFALYLLPHHIYIPTTPR